jgi:FemAB-related protein (PEP-CTERM system-associated)
MSASMALTTGERAVPVSPGLQVHRLGESDEDRWDSFVRGTKGSTFYHLSGWRSLIEEQLQHPAHYLFCEVDGRIQAVLPLVHVKSLLFGNALISVPFLVYGGPVAATAAAQDAVVAAARELAVELSVDYLELRNQRPIDGEWQLSDSNVTFRRRIDPDPEANLMAIPRKQRAMVRKGIQAGLQAEIDDDTRRLYSALLACKRNLGTPFFAASWLQAIKAKFRDLAEITTITHHGRTICSVMSFIYGNEILPYYGGGGEQARDLKGNDFMYWAVMENACKNGLDTFDFGRSSAGTGAYRFKMHWGFEPEPLAYQYYLVNAASLPDLKPSNPRYRLMIKAWQRLPLPLAGRFGPPLARRLG